MSIEIMPVRDEHIEGFHALLDEVAREQRYLAFLKAPPLDATADYVALVHTGRLIHYVAIDAGRVVGWCDIILSDRDSMRHTGSLGIGLAPAYRDQGLGARLMAAAITAAGASGVVRIALQVRADNTRAIRLYERLGFRHEGRFRRNIRIDGVDHDSLAMALLLDEVEAA